MIEAEHEHTPSHGTGIRWLDVVMTVAVVFISVISLVVSINHGRTMEKLVAENKKMVSASTMPYLEMGWQSYDPVQKKQVAGVVLENAGIGPAVIDWVEMRYKGKVYANSADLMKACCGVAPTYSPHGYYYSTPSSRILPAHETLKVIWFDPQDTADKAAFDALAASQGDISYRGCYCSVLDECWSTDFDGSRPKPIATCPVEGVTPFR